MDASIVIAHRGDPLGLWATIHSIDIELRDQKIDYDYHIVANGSGRKDVPYDLKRLVDFTRDAGHLGSFENYPEALTPPVARQRAAQCATGGVLFFFDNHILVAKDYFRRALADFAAIPEMDMLHSATMFYSGEFVHYHYKLKLDFNFWAESSNIPVHPYKPYRIAAGGHGGFAVRRSVWEEVGGYGPENLFSGYAGEEIYFDLKMALLDKTNWIDPRVIHYHYAGNRGYPRHHSDDYYRNLMTCAYIIGGEPWVNKIYMNFTQAPKALSGHSLYQLYKDAFERGKDHAAYLASIRHRTLDEQLKKFSAEQIAR